MSDDRHFVLTTEERVDINPIITRLFEWNEFCRRSGADTGAVVGDRFVGNGELAEVVANHVGL